MGDQLADLLARHAVGEGALEVPRELVAAIHGDEGRDGDEAPVALGQAGASSVGTITLTIPALDPDVEKLLCPYVRIT